MRDETWAILTTSLTSSQNVAQEKVPVVIRRPLLLTRDFGLIWLSQLVAQVGDGIRTSPVSGSCIRLPVRR